MSFCCSDCLVERSRELANKSLEGFVRVMPIIIEGVFFLGDKPPASIAHCDCGAPSEFNISYQNKEGAYVWPRRA
ncbi:hypothetical protein LCGC14_0744050 [marine sediment metagenome]|uniref:Uncharacterized protein n=1 Tax=marine sediment metagenome TaxID=412755 RepID=A0A0F9SQX9_9ZZZZ